MFKFTLVLVLGSFTFCQCLTSSKKVELYPLSVEYERIAGPPTQASSVNMASNMREAKRWLDEEISKSGNENLSKALEIFTSMDSLSGCIREELDDLKANDYLTAYDAGRVN